MSNGNYRKTAVACYMGFVTQAITANFAPLLFLTFKDSYGIPLGKIALISTVFFFTQLLTDLICAKAADRIGYRPSVVASEAFSAAGLIGLAFLPNLTKDPFTGIMICVVLYAMGSGLIEVLVSPIMEACPFEHKEAAMSLTHSFYCWGSVAVILFSTLFFTAFGIRNWPVLSCFWALIPIVNIYLFATCPINTPVETGESMSIRQLLKDGRFRILVILMVCSGASELSMAQWASAFTESALHVTKTVGDLAGPCLFAVLMGICRVLYAKIGFRIDLKKVMTASGVLCVLCYLLAGISKNPVFGLAGCAVCGFASGIMWPGTISTASRTLPFGGTAMFALLALAGDLGGSIGPALVGTVSELAGGSLQVGILAGTVFPVLLIVGILLLRRDGAKKA